MEGNFPEPLDLTKLKVFPLAERKSLTKVQEILIEPGADPRELSTAQAEAVEQCAASHHRRMQTQQPKRRHAHLRRAPPAQRRGPDHAEQ